MMPITKDDRIRTERIADELDGSVGKGPIKEAWASFDGIGPAIYVRFHDHGDEEFIKLKVQNENGPLSC